MKYERKTEEEARLLNQTRELTISDFKQLDSGMPMTSVYARVRSLVQEGKLVPIGKGIYLSIPKPKYHLPVSERMRELNEVMFQNCEGVHHCIFESDGQLVVLVPQNDISTVIESLKRCYDKVIPKDMADRYPGMWDGFVLVGSLVSDAPLLLECGVFVPSLEKQIVDALSGGPTVRFTLQKFMEIYPVNYNRMRRYASRRGLSEELSSFLTNLDTERIDMFSKLQRYMAGTAIVKAWVFGSFARGEEKKDSDLDILVDYDPSANLSLLGAIRYKLDMEKLIGREVDLVENGCLKPFAIPSVEHDKYLVYER